MTSLCLKLIAVLCMLTDHIGVILLPEFTVTVFGHSVAILRVIGRLAFPLYCFLLTEGLRHTSDWKKYFLRLAIFAVLSEPCADWAFYGVWIDWEYQNIFFSLLTGAVVIKICEFLTQKRCMDPEKTYFWIFCQISVFGIGLLAAQILRFDYGAFGICLMFLMALANQTETTGRLTSAAVCAALNLSQYPATQMYAALAAFPILLYNGKPGVKNKLLQISFYAFYPVHLLILAFFAA